MKKIRLAYPVAEPAYAGKVKAFTGEYAPAFAWLRQQGYAGVELLIASPDTVDASQLEKELARANLELAVIGTSPMQIGEKLFLLHPDEANRKEARRRMSGLLQLCDKFRVPAVIGKYRGQLADRDGCRESDLEAVLTDICREAQRLDVPVLLEPQNATNINNINTIADGLAWIDRIGSSNLGLLADIYHMSITEASLTGSLRAAAGHIGFVHMADSDRKIPGTGNLPLPEVVRTLEACDYPGYVSLEIGQIPDSRTAAAQSAHYLLSLS